MALYDQIQSEMVNARVQRDDVALGTLSLLKSELVRASKEGSAGGRIDDELVVRVARKEVKRREEAIDVYRKAGRDESARREEAEMAVLRGYIPAGLTDAQVEEEVRAVIQEVKPNGPKGFGAVMKVATARLAGRAEGAQIAADVMHRTGLSPRGEEDDAVRWVAVRHGADHIHIVAMLARQDGGKPSLSNERYRVREACRAAEERYGLRRTAPADRTAARRPTRAEREKTRRHQRQEPPRVTLRRAVNGAAAGGAREEEVFLGLIHN